MDLGTNPISTFIECIYKAVALRKKLEQDGLNIVETDSKLEDLSKNLDEHLNNLAVFALEHWNTTKPDERKWIDWTKAAMSWVCEMRKVCRIFKDKAEALRKEDPSLDVIAESVKDTGLKFSDIINFDEATMSGRITRPKENLMSFREMEGTVDALRGRARDVRERFEELKSMKKTMQDLLTVRIIEPRNPVVLPLESDVEEGEIKESTEEIRAARWREFDEFKSHVTYLSSSLESTQKTQLDCIRVLDQRLTAAEPPLPKLEIIPEELDKAVSSSVERWLRPEKERLLVQVEDELLKFKADYYCQLLKTIQPLVDEVEKREKEM